MAYRFLSVCWLVLLIGIGSGYARAATPLPPTSSDPLHMTVSQLQESSASLDLTQAMHALARGEFTSSRSSTPTFGIGVKPVWIHVGLDHAGSSAVLRRLSIDIAWLDHVDLYLVHDGSVLASEHLGDRQVQSRRPVPGRVFASDLRIPPGHSDVMIRVATPDPMVIPIRLRTIQQSVSDDSFETATYGLFYGFLFALLAYNLMLWFGLRSSPYGLYALYLAVFIGMNLSYTGYGFEWIWPDSPTWEQWAPPTMMVLCTCSGLLFAQRFLHTRHYFPRLHRGVYVFMALGMLTLAITVAAGWQAYALLLAFAIVLVFTIIMLGLGILSFRIGNRSSRYFLLAAACSMAGDAITALAVWGKLPFNTWTFRAAEIGMVLDATLLALALTYRFRRDEERRMRAEHLARVDPLTGMNNRRAFQDISHAIWNSARLENRRLSVILLDIDHFKRVNDTHGHAGGDLVLKSLSGVLREAMRERDVIARWGGEEFIVLLPDTSLDEAVAMAERLRQAVSSHAMDVPHNHIHITASFGVTERRPNQNKLEALIAEADQLMYRAKRQGRNRVCHLLPDANTPQAQSFDVAQARQGDLSGL